MTYIGTVAVVSTARLALLSLAESLRVLDSNSFRLGFLVSRSRSLQIFSLGDCVFRPWNEGVLRRNDRLGLRLWQIGRLLLECHSFLS